jgi:tetratricopeptide (TPR) repeat protein
VYDGNYKEAIDYFRKILNYKPSNIVAANNIATCHMYIIILLILYSFCNDVIKAIELL